MVALANEASVLPFPSSADGLSGISSNFCGSVAFEPVIFFFWPFSLAFVSAVASSPVADLDIFFGVD